MTIVLKLFMIVVHLLWSLFLLFDTDMDSVRLSVVIVLSTVCSLLSMVLVVLACLCCYKRKSEYDSDEEEEVDTKQLRPQTAKVRKQKDNVIPLYIISLKIIFIEDILIGKRYKLLFFPLIDHPICLQNYIHINLIYHNA